MARIITKTIALARNLFSLLFYKLQQQLFFRFNEIWMHFQISHDIIDRLLGFHAITNCVEGWRDYGDPEFAGANSNDATTYSTLAW